MVSEKMEKALNQQIELEGYASSLYLSMASWCDRESLEGCATFMYRQSEEERQHMLRIFNYLNEMDGHALSPGLPSPPHEWTNVQTMFQEVFEHEKKVTKAIYELIALSYETKDHATLNFLQWYVEEQREEETLMRSIIDRIKLIGDSPMSLYYIDKEVRDINAQAEKEEAEGE